VVADLIPLENQDRSLVLSKSNLLNFSTNVIHGMQVIRFLAKCSYCDLTTIEFLSNSWDNIKRLKMKRFSIRLVTRINNFSWLSLKKEEQIQATTNLC
jgi:hypothetical protein